MGNTWSKLGELVVVVAVSLIHIFASRPTQSRQVDESVLQELERKRKAEMEAKLKAESDRLEQLKLEKAKSEAAQVEADNRLKRAEADRLKIERELQIETDRLERMKLDEAKSEAAKVEADNRLKRVEADRLKIAADIQSKRDELERQEKKKSEIDQAVKLEEVKLQSTRAELQCYKEKRYELKVEADLEALYQSAQRSIGIDMKNKINFAVIGQRGVGKSTLINGVRGLKPGEAGAAKVGVNETTMVMQQYTFPGADHLVIWDVPGCNTLNHSGTTYFVDKFLFSFEILLIVFTSCLAEAEIDLIKQAIAYHVPFAIVRNKANIDYDNLCMDDPDFAAMPKEESKDQLIHEHRQTIIDCLRQAEIDPERSEIFIINSRAFIKNSNQIAFEEGKLLEHVLNKVAKDRYNVKQ